MNSTEKRSKHIKNFEGIEFQGNLFKSWILYSDLNYVANAN